MKITDYLKEVKAEMAHVTFPSKNQTSWFTLLVIAISVGVSLYLGLFDYLFKLGLQKIFNL